METVGMVFGILGLIALIEIFPLQNRVKALERELSRMDGTSYAESARSLSAAVKEQIGKNVKIELQEGEQDVDISMYGNSGHGSNTVIDTDDEWMLVRVEGPKGVKEKLIRLSSVQRIELR
ncbi:MAG: hypothetical protein IKG59_05925 [Firmicutes bacterium]|jgi:hypothetical protein|nr:hypothetical protein [Eubacterium sp.]MBR3053653.1 hypothetical protein [Bacillota bacterium]